MAVRIGSLLEIAILISFLIVAQEMFTCLKIVKKS